MHQCQSGRQLGLSALAHPPADLRHGVLSVLPVTRPQRQIVRFRRLTSDTIQAMKSGITGLPDIIGITAVALASGVLAAALYRMQAVSDPWLVWLIALPFLVGGSLWMWHFSSKTRAWDSEKWGYMVIFTPVIGAVSFGIDVLVGSSNGHYKTLLEAASHAGSPFGFPLTVLICPIGTLVALGGWLRSLLVQASKPNSEAPS